MTAVLLPPTIEPAPRRRGPGSGLLLLLGLLCSVIVIASATYTLVSLWWLRSETTTTSVPAAALVEVRQDCGGVTIREGDVSEIQVTMKTWSTFHKPVLKTVSSSGGPVVVRVLCGSFELGGFSGTASLKLVVPRGINLDVSTSAGSVSATNLSATSVIASSSAGGVHLSFVTAPTNVNASSSAGSVSVTVPRDGTAYAVEVGSSAGSTSVDVATNPDSTRHIKAHSSAGNVKVDRN